MSKLIVRAKPYIILPNPDGSTFPFHAEVEIEPARLLDEAVRFFNYRDKRIRKKDWKDLNEKNIKKAINTLLESFRSTIISDIRSLQKNKNLTTALNKEIVEKAKKNKHCYVNNKGNLIFYYSYVGVYAVLLYLDGIFRNPRHTKHREFDLLLKRIKELRELISLDKIKMELDREFRNNSKQHFYKQIFGSQYSIVLEGEVLPEKLRLSEKLYYCFSASLFKKAHHYRYLRCSVFKWLDDIKNRCNEIRQYSLPKHKATCWNSWFSCIDILENHFCQTLTTTDKRRTSLRDESIRLGLPIALVLLGFLRAYLTELMCRVLTLALPLALHELHQRVNGYSAIAFWESLSTLPAPHPNNYSILADFGCMGKLHEWRTWHWRMANIWGEDISVNKAANQRLEEIYNAPVVSEVIYKGSSPHISVVATRVTSFEDYIESLRKFPEILPNTEPFSQALNWLAPLSNGATFLTQAHFYIAMQIMHKFLRGCGLDKPEKKYSSKEIIKHRRALHNLTLTSCSFLWDGKMPPHKTHRNGACLDIVFGPRLIQWPLTRFIDLINDLSNLPQKHPLKKKVEEYLKERVLIYKYKAQRKWFINDPLAICYLQKQVEQFAEKTAPDELFLFRRVLVALIRNKFKEFVDETSSKKSEKGLILNLLADIENSFIGTPHFIDPSRFSNIRVELKNEDLIDHEDILRTHIAHTAILLSAPRHIIFASPIVHLRAIKAVLNAFMGGAEEKRALELARNVVFSFLPKDHHDHWHVEYLRRSWVKGPDEYIYKKDPYKWFEYWFPLWQALDIDLTDFSSYLKDYYNILKSRDASITKDLENVREKCEEYNKFRQTKNSNSSKEVYERFANLFKSNEFAKGTITETMVDGIYPKDSLILKANEKSRIMSINLLPLAIQTMKARIESIRNYLYELKRIIPWEESFKRFGRDDIGDAL